MDFKASWDSSMVILVPITAAGRDWAEHNLPDDCPQMGRAYAIERNYIEPILEGIAEAGLEVA